MAKQQADDEPTTLRAEREKVLSDLYATRAHVDPEGKVRNLQHKVLEKRYNDVEKGIHVLEGNPASTYQYKRDVRHEFKFDSESRQTRRGTYRVDRAEGPVYHPDTVINWRKTEIGAAKDQELRNQTRRQLGATAGDDVGHRIALSAGVDPAERRNVGLQNFHQNEGGGTYHKYEHAQREWLRDHPGQHLHARVEEAYHSGRHGPTRSCARKVTTADGQGNVVFQDNLVFANPHSASGRVRTQAPKEPPPAPAAGQKPHLVRIK